MENVNVVSTPDIAGNIGSCTTQVTRRTASRDGFFTETIEEIATNSCTGDVSSKYHWEFTGIGFTMCILALVVVIISFGVSIKIADSY